SYDAHRPGYPVELAQDVIRISGIPPGGEMVEIGCGTGQATRPYAERGYRLTCLDIGPETAAKARENFRLLPNVTVLVSSFEDWTPAHNNYDLAIAAAAFHWLTPGSRFPKIARLLKPGGALAMYANAHKPPEDGFFKDIREIYARLAPGLRKKTAGDGPPPPEEGVELFEPPVLSSYPWEKTFRAREYTAHIGTFSDHAVLPEDVRRQLYAELETLIDGKYGGTVTKHFVAQLAVFKKKK
ncbi:MAG TPA: class I SAM-dependent methyltransferase, partial [Elusimicrobiales bacterium]|nr:class I SAM-dependent methyltransferase [Elusimicrobiales bacterium]